MKKIFFLIIIFSALFLTHPLSANATQVYVGVTITKAEAPGCVPGTSNCGTSYANALKDENWCLPVGSKMAITQNQSCSYFETGNSDPADICQYNYCGNNHCLSATSPSTNPITSNQPVCPGTNNDTMWSGLLDLTSGSQYKIYLYAPSFCPGIVDGSYCWVAGVNKSCNEVCGGHNLTPAGYGSCYNYYGTYDGNTGGYNCSAMEKLKGSTCSTCQGTSSYSYYSGSNCFYNTNYGYDYSPDSCTWKDAGAGRVCACNYAYNNGATGFLFDFTAAGF